MRQWFCGASLVVLMSPSSSVGAAQQQQLTTMLDHQRYRQGIMLNGIQFQDEEAHSRYITLGTLVEDGSNHASVCHSRLLLYM
jgi:hypothetical protein